MKAGGLNLCIAQLGGSLKKALEYIGIGLKCMFIVQFFKANSLKKIRPITLGAREGLKNAYKRVKKAFQK